jgi:uncharacterized small protein (DUF1192 family)
MAFDPFADEQPLRSPIGHQVGQDLSTLSIEEIDERIAFLEQEIGRLREARANKESSRAAASAFFKIGSS